MIDLARQEQAKGNTSITSDKLDKLQGILESSSSNNNKSQSLSNKSSYNFDKFQLFKQIPTDKAKPRAKPKYPLFLTNLILTNPWKRRSLQQHHHHKSWRKSQLPHPSRRGKEVANFSKQRSFHSNNWSLCL